jgi:branched-chain amino acid transport system substrate-binding protein
MEKKTAFVFGTRIFLLLTIWTISLSGFGVADSTGIEDEIPLYALIPAGEEILSKGEATKAALEIATAEMNTLYEEIGSEKRVVLNTTNYSLEPGSALSAIEKLNSSGIHMVLGYFTSSDLTEIKPYADSHDMLILSTGSTATSLSVDDNIIRFNPDDSNMADTIVLLLKNENMNDIVPLVRDDIWGNELVSSIHSKMETDKTQDDIERYDPDVSSFEDVVSRLDTRVGTVLAEEKAENVGVLAITFGEIAPIMEEASDAKYPNLSLVRWFGTDGNTLIPDITNSPVASKFAEDQRFTGTTYSRFIMDQETPVTDEFIAKIGYDPDGYAYATYDMAKIAVRAFELRGSNNAPALKIAVTAIADMYSGPTGETSLIETGDRSEIHFAFWKVKNYSSGKGTWEFIGEANKWESELLPEISMIEKNLG